MKDYSQSYKKAVQTRKERYGEDAFAQAAAKRVNPYHGFSDPRTAYLAVMKRHHPEYFGKDGKLLPRFEPIIQQKFNQKGEASE